MTTITKTVFDTLRRRAGVQIVSERDTEFWYETIVDENGDEIAFASYKTGEPATYTYVYRGDDGLLYLS